MLRASAEKEARILKAEAEKQAAILKAEGEAQAILSVQKATADALKLLNEAHPNEQVIKLKALESMQVVANGQSTKIIIPSEMQGLAGLATGIKEVIKE
jgi:regulator of protease activity HflC (stomatin/prohibitin superfamily)